MTTDREIKAKRMKIFWADLGATQDDFAAVLRSRGLWPNCRSGTVAQWLNGKYSPKVARVLAAVDPKKRDAGWFMGMGEEVREPEENYLRTAVLFATRDHKLRDKLTDALDRCQRALDAARQEIDKILRSDMASDLYGLNRAAMDLASDVMVGKCTVTDAEEDEGSRSHDLGTEDRSPGASIKATKRRK